MSSRRGAAHSENEKDNTNLRSNTAACPFDIPPHGLIHCHPRPRIFVTIPIYNETDRISLLLSATPVTAVEWMRRLWSRVAHVGVTYGHMDLLMLVPRRAKMRAKMSTTSSKEHGRNLSALRTKCLMDLSYQMARLRSVQLNHYLHVCSVFEKCFHATWMALFETEKRSENSIRLHAEAH